jgi:hypothetical protein
MRVQWIWRGRREVRAQGRGGVSQVLDEEDAEEVHEEATYDGTTMLANLSYAGETQMTCLF